MIALTRRRFRVARTAAGTSMFPAVLILAAMFLALAVPSSAHAQANHGFSLVFGVGYASGGWGPSLVDAFRENGMDQASSGVCIGAYCDPPVDYPVHYLEGIGVQVSAGFQYRARLPLSLEVLASNGIWGHAEGNSNDRDEHLLVKYQPLLVAATAGPHLGPVRVGVGPALNRTSWEYDYNHGSTGSQSTLTPGLAGSVRVDLNLDGFLVAGRADLNVFPDVEVRNRSSTTLEPGYRSLILGISVHPALGR